MFGAVELAQRFHGYGVEGGLWSEWDIGAGFSLLWHVGRSILYSRFKILRETKGFLTEETDLVFRIKGKHKVLTGIPTLDYFVGLQYVTLLFGAAFAIHAGWEQHIFLIWINRQLQAEIYQGKG